MDEDFGMGIGFAAVGLIFTLLSFFKPDFFKRLEEKAFYRMQGVFMAFLGFGVGMLLWALVD